MHPRQLVALAVVLSLLAAGTARPAASGSGGSASPDLRTTLEKGLRARRPEEFRLIARVVQLVNQGRLDEGIVRATFLWARRQRRHPFQYFEFAIRRRAREVGVRL